jgi:hypothetical protein
MESALPAWPALATFCTPNDGRSLTYGGRSMTYPGHQPADGSRSQDHPKVPAQFDKVRPSMDRDRRGQPGYTIRKGWLTQRAAAQTVAVRRFETRPGKEAQVDWEHLGTTR